MKPVRPEQSPKPPVRVREHTPDAPWDTPAPQAWTPQAEYVLRIERRPEGLRLCLRQGQAPLQPVQWREFTDTDALLRYLWSLLEPGGLK